MDLLFEENEERRKDCLACAAAWIVEKYGMAGAERKIKTISEKISEGFAQDGVEPAMSLMVLEFISFHYRDILGKKFDERMALLKGKPS